MRAVSAIVVLVLGCAARSPTYANTTPFEVGYRAWDIVTDLARQHRDPRISGECGRTFRPFVIPGLKPQARAEQDNAAAACLAAARGACANPALQRGAEVAKKCEEFR